MPGRLPESERQRIIDDYEAERIQRRVEWGTCFCGCNEETSLAKQTDRRAKTIDGHPLRFVLGHNTRKSAIAYTTRDLGYHSPCWVWLRSTNNKGYAVGYDGGKVRLAHRMYYEQEHGPIPDGLGLDHLCISSTNGEGGSIRCVNPDHLEATTQAENIRRSITTKLTQQDVEHIHSLLAQGLQRKEIAIMFDMSKTAIDRIAQGEGWR